MHMLSMFSVALLARFSAHIGTLLALHSLFLIWLLFFISLQPFRPSLQALFEDYWRLMPEYQQLPGGLQQLEFQRLLFGFFPTYKDSPLAPGFDRCSFTWQQDSPITV
jgi:hypothetical protein